MKNIILTGSSGFIGRYVLKQLIEDGYCVYSIVRNENRIKDINSFLDNNSCEYKGRLSYIISDLNDLSIDSFNNVDFYAWVHLAWGGVNREEIDDDRVQEQNYENSVECLNICNELGCKRFIETGSRAECGRDLDVIPEEMAGEPLNAYGRYKKKFYEHAYSFCKTHALYYLHLRLFAVTGPGDHPWALAYDCCNKFKYNKKMEFGKCEQIWNYIDVRDVAKFVSYCLEYDNEIELNKDYNSIINVASEVSIPLKEYILTIYNLVKSKSILSFGLHNNFSSNPCTKKMKTYYKLNKPIEFKKTITDILREIERERA